MSVGANDLDFGSMLAPDAEGGLTEATGALDLSALRAAAQQASARLVYLAGVGSKQELLAAIAVGLDLPSWSGSNWDALEETLGAPAQELSGPLLLVWPRPQVLAAADPTSARAFRSIVAAAARARHERGAGPLVLVSEVEMTETERPFDLPLSSPTRVHHVAVVVRDMDSALTFYRDRLRLPLDVLLPIPSDGVRIAFLPVGESSIELVEPTDSTTGVARFLETRGEGFHHVCLEVDDVAAELERLAAAGVELIDKAPRRGAEGPVAFIHPRSCHGVLIELIEALGGPAWTELGYDPPTPESRAV